MCTNMIYITCSFHKLNQLMLDTLTSLTSYKALQSKNTRLLNFDSLYALGVLVWAIAFNTPKGLQPGIQAGAELNKHFEQICEGFSQCLQDLRDMRKLDGKIRCLCGKYFGLAAQFWSSGSSCVLALWFALLAAPLLSICSIISGRHADSGIVPAAGSIIF